MTPRSLSERNPILGCLLGITLLFACLIALIYLESMDLKAKEVYIDQTIKLGMTRAEVYQQFDKTASYRVDRFEDRACSVIHPALSKIEEGWISPPIPNGQAIGRVLCFDHADRLIEIYAIRS